MRDLDGRKRSRRRRGGTVAPGTADLIAAYRVALERRAVRPGSITSITGKLWLLAEDLAPAELLDATADQIEAWLDGRQLVPRSRYTYVSHLHRFYEWAIRDGRATTDPTLTIVRPKLPRHLPRPITDADLAHALDQADDTMRAMLLLGDTNWCHANHRYLYPQGHHKNSGPGGAANTPGPATTLTGGS